MPFPVNPFRTGKVNRYLKLNLNKESLFGENFKKYRKKKGISQKEFAHLLYEATGKKLTLTSISNYETGLHLPPPQVLPVVAEILGVSIDALFGTEAVLPAGEEELLYVRRYRQELEELKKELSAILSSGNGPEDKQFLFLQEQCGKLIEMVGSQQDELQNGYSRLAAVRKMIAVFRDRL